MSDSDTPHAATPLPPPALTRRACLQALSAALLLGRAGQVARAADTAPEPALPEGLVFPGNDWTRISPAEAGFDAPRLDRIFAAAHLGPGGYGGTAPNEREWGAVLTRGGYLVYAFGDPHFRHQSASLGKCFTRLLLGLAIDEGRVRPDDLVARTWTGRGDFSQPHKLLDEGYHQTLTWRHLAEHQGGFPGLLPGDVLPAWRKLSGDPLYDAYSQTTPGTSQVYSNAGYWRLSQALTVLFDRDLKAVLDARLFGPLGIPADRWEWISGRTFRETGHLIYPAIPSAGTDVQVDPPYELRGHVVRGGPGWIAMGSADLARYGLLIASGGVWAGRRLVSAGWLGGHAGLNIHTVAGDPDTLVSLAKINCVNFPFGDDAYARKTNFARLGVYRDGTYSFPPELIRGPVQLAPRR
jgi:CubicO group peptidase (beta-lactamase class C family)